MELVEKREMSLFGFTSHVAQVQVHLLENWMSRHTRAFTHCPDTDTAGINIGHLFLQASPQTPFSPFGMEALTCKGTWGCGVVRSFLLVPARYCGGCWYGIFLEYVLMLSSPLGKGPLVPGSRGMAMAVAIPSIAGTRASRSTPDTVPWYLCSHRQWSCRPQLRESGGDATPRKDTRQDR